jgi:hypothetical protein
MFPMEQHFEQAVREVRESSRLDLLFESQGLIRKRTQTAESAFRALANAGYPIHPTFQKGYFRQSSLALHWRSCDPETTLAGEFNLVNIAISPDREIPDDDLSIVNDEQLLWELCIFDSITRGGDGNIGALRFQEGTMDPEVWYLDRYRGLIRLDLDYCEYLTNLVVTKGAYGWQYLFADVRLGGFDYSYVLKSLEAMLRIFPEEFPNHDYTRLAARLEARL